MGGGFTFHLFRCDSCPETTSIPFEKIGEPHVRFLKGIGVPFSRATADDDRRAIENYKGEPMSPHDYYKAVEAIAGKCVCGGQFRWDAKPRCRKCKSTEIVLGKTNLLYD